MVVFFNLPRRNHFQHVATTTWLTGSPVVASIETWYLATRAQISVVFGNTNDGLNVSNCKDLIFSCSTEPFSSACALEVRFWYGQRLVAWFDDFGLSRSLGLRLNLWASMPNVRNAFFRTHFFIFLKFSFLGDSCVVSKSRSTDVLREFWNPVSDHF